MSRDQELRLKELTDAGVSLEFAEEFSETNLPAGVVKEYEECGLTLHNVHDVETLGISPSELRQWLDLLFLSSYVHQVFKVGLALEDAHKIFEGKVDPERSTLIQLLEQGASIDELLLLRENGTYFFRTTATKDRPLREVFLDELFGSRLLRSVWTLAGATPRQAIASMKAGVTPYKFVLNLSPESATPTCTWITETKSYDFGEFPLPSEFTDIVGLKKNQLILEAIGYEVCTKRLKAEFLAAGSSTVVLEASSTRGKNFVVGFSLESGNWKSVSLSSSDNIELDTSEGTLLDCGHQVLRQLVELKASIKKLSYRLGSEGDAGSLFRIFANWCEKYGDNSLPTINGEYAIRVRTIDSEELLIPEIESELRPGLDVVKRIGNVACRFVGTLETPFVVIADSDDEEIRTLTNTAVNDSKDAISALIIRRHALNDAFETEFETEDPDPKISSITEYFRKTEVESLKVDEGFKISVHQREYLEIWSDENLLTTDDLVRKLILDPNLAASTSKSSEENEDDFHTLIEFASNADLPTWEGVSNHFEKLALISINGVRCLNVCGFNDAFVRFDDEQGSAEVPNLIEIWVRLSSIEYESRTSGTFWDLLGLVTPDLMVSANIPDEDEVFLQFSDRSQESDLKQIANWLTRADDWSYEKFSAYIFVEELVGELPDSDEISADWLVEGESSSLCFCLETNFPPGVNPEDVLQELLKDPEVASYHRGIVDPNSPEAKKRQQRHEAYFGTHESC